MISYGYDSNNVGDTCKSFDVRKENGDLLVAVNVNFVKLDRLEIASGFFLLKSNVSDHLEWSI